MSTLLRDHPEALGPLETLADVVRYLREHQDSHRQWVTWLRKHPEDASPEVDSAEYQERSVERYERLIAVINTNAAEIDRMAAFTRSCVARGGELVAEAAALRSQVASLRAVLREGVHRLPDDPSGRVHKWRQTAAVALAATEPGKAVAA